MDDEGWVTGDALFTAKALGLAIQVGDEVKLDLKSVDTYGIEVSDHGKVVRITERANQVSFDYHDERYRGVQSYRGMTMGRDGSRLTGWWLTDVQIAAWRPCNKEPK